MSAAVSLPQPQLDPSDPRVLFATAMRMTEDRLLRLTELEGQLVDLLDALDLVRDEIRRGQSMQIELLTLISRSAR